MERKDCSGCGYFSPDFDEYKLSLFLSPYTASHFPLCSGYSKKYFYYISSVFQVFPCLEHISICFVFHFEAKMTGPKQA